MLIATITVKTDSRKYAVIELLPEDYVVAKTNPDFQALVKKACDESRFDPIEEVNVRIAFEW